MMLQCRILNSVSWQTLKLSQLVLNGRVGPFILDVRDAASTTVDFLLHLLLVIVEVRQRRVWTYDQILWIVG